MTVDENFSAGDMLCLYKGTVGKSSLLSPLNPHIV